MAKTLDFAYQTPQEVKVGDDETTFTLICQNEDRAVDLTGSKSIIAKIGNRSGYLRGQLISLDSSAGLHAGKINLTFEKSTLNNFPPGLYNLEIWVIDSNGTSIYPSGNPLSFTVTSNLESGSGKTITTVAFDDFVEAMNKSASTIAKGDKGDKGDTGSVDNAGLTTAPAFVKLQKQVNDSTTDTNLLIGTNNILTTVTDATGWGGIGLPASHPTKTLKANQAYTLSCYLEPATHDVSVVMATAHGNILGNIIAAGSKGISKLTTTLTQEDVAVIRNCWVAFSHEQKDKSSVSFKGFKLKKVA